MFGQTAPAGLLPSLYKFYFYIAALCAILHKKRSAKSGLRGENACFG